MTQPLDLDALEGDLLPGEHQFRAVIAELRAARAVAEAAEDLVNGPHGDDCDASTLDPSCSCDERRRVAVRARLREWRR
jgi:hypothetical protein